jgi:hypothetical protein
MLNRVSFKPQRGVIWVNDGANTNIAPRWGLKVRSIRHLLPILRPAGALIPEIKL